MQQYKVAIPAKHRSTQQQYLAHVVYHSSSAERRGTQQQYLPNVEVHSNSACQTL